ncbi:MAG: tyrosine--tRNA ligase [Thaumarchaeota archaeon]|nr:tyrosine--tRNA ligase [Nitrososphaerota archaeon]
MDTEEKMRLVLRPPTEEVVTEQDLRALLEREPHPKHYIGLEVSGVLNLGSLVVNGFKVNDFIKAGMKCTVFLADWHSYINNKWGGDWDKIKKVGHDYYAEAFRFFCPGVEIRYGSELYHDNDQYWQDTVRFSKQISLERDVRCLTIMGRSIKEKLDVAQYLYPPMQATDIHAMDLDVVHAGLDQRKVHILAREVFPSLGWKKPVAIHHHILAGLQEPHELGLDENPLVDRTISSKMSKSKPDTAIFIHDSPQEIARKIGKAWCPEKWVEGNPILDFAHYIVFHEKSSFTIERPQKFGGDVTYASYEELAKDYSEGKVHPSDLKKAVARELSETLAPVRAHFEGKDITKEILAA